MANIRSASRKDRDVDGEVLGKVHRYLRDSGMSATRFGRHVARDPRLVLDMRNGRSPRAAMVAKIDAFIAAHPAGGQ